MKYHRLTKEERIEIYLYNKLGKSAREIGKLLHRHHSTISRELARGRYTQTGDYKPWEAQEIAENQNWRRRWRKGKLFRNKKLRKEVIKKLKLRWSPEQISVYLSRKYPTKPQMQVSPETIYTYVYIYGRKHLKKCLSQYLRQKKQGRNFRKRQKKGRHFEDMISIEERPAEVEDRTIPGHWEGDLIIGKDHKSAIGTLVERTTRFLLMVPLKDMEAPTVRKAFARALRKLPEQVQKSLTYDQGSEMSEHKLFTKATKMQVYFAHPHSPWERGTNENTNMLIRDFYPKGTDFTKLSRYQIKRVERLLNERPRKILDHQTPAEAMNRILQEVNI